MACAKDVVEPGNSAEYQLGVGLQLAGDTPGCRRAGAALAGGNRYVTQFPASGRQQPAAELN